MAPLMNRPCYLRKKWASQLCPVGGYTKRLDQYGAVPPFVLAQERRLKALEALLERGRRWQLARCERERRATERRLEALREARERRDWLPPLGHTEYLYGGCMAVRMGPVVHHTESDTLDSVSRSNRNHRFTREGIVYPRSTTDCQRHLHGAKADRSQAQLPAAGADGPRPPPRKARSWATLRRQFGDRVLGGDGPGKLRPAPDGRLPPLGNGRRASCGAADGGGDERAESGDGFAAEMKRCRYLRLPPSCREARD